MRQIRLAVLAGAATLLASGAALAASSRTHDIELDLPDGSVAHISYEGDVAPQVQVAPAFDAVASPDPFGPSPFAAFDRISAEMNRQAADMIRQVAQMQRVMAAGSSGLRGAATAAVPAGTMMQYSFVSTSSGDGGCTQSVEWRSDGSGAEPRVIRTSSGNCAGGVDHGETAKPVTTSAPVGTAPQPDDII